MLTLHKIQTKIDKMAGFNISETRRDRKHTALDSKSAPQISQKQL